MVSMIVLWENSPTVNCWSKQKMFGTKHIFPCDWYSIFQNLEATALMPWNGWFLKCVVPLSNTWVQREQEALEWCWCWVLAPGRDCPGRNSRIKNSFLKPFLMVDWKHKQAWCARVRFLQELVIFLFFFFFCLLCLWSTNCGKLHIVHGRILLLSVAQGYTNASLTDFEFIQHYCAALWYYNTMFPPALLTYAYGN